MRIFGLAGWSGSGKTTLMTALIPEFVSRGITVSTVKHAHHFFDIDQPGKDSWRHRQAGAREVMVASGQRWALMHELRGRRRASARRVAGADELRSIWCWSKASNVIITRRSRSIVTRSESRLLHPDDPFVVAVASDRAAPEFSRPWLPLSDAAAIASFILDHEAGLGSMAQLSDDCFAFGDALLSVDEALAPHRGARHGSSRDGEEAAARCLRAHSRRRCRCRDQLAAARQQRRRRLCLRSFRSGAGTGNRASGFRQSRGGSPARALRRAGHRCPDLHRRPDARRHRHGDDAGGLHPRRREGAAQAGHQEGSEPTRCRGGRCRGGSCARRRAAALARGSRSRRGVGLLRPAGLSAIARGAALHRR